MSINEAAFRADLKRAMLAKDRARTSVLRAVLSAAKNRAIELKQSGVDDIELIAILRREIKQRHETLDFARKASRADTAAELAEEIAMLEEYLPNQLGEEELRAAISTFVADNKPTSIGPVMKELSSRYPGRFDGKLASRLAQELIGK